MYNCVLAPKPKATPHRKCAICQTPIKSRDFTTRKPENKIMLCRHHLKIKYEPLQYSITNLRRLIQNA